MRVLSPSSISRLYAPSRCDLRTWLKTQGEVEESPDGPFQVFLREQGIRHEKAVVDRLAKERPDWVDIDGYANPLALEETQAAVEAGRGFIYQGQLQQETEILGEPVRLLGYPDFLVLRDGGYTIGDAKLARSIYESRADGSRKPKSSKQHIIYQLQLYGWLFSKQFPDLEFDLLVYNGAGEQEPVDVAGDAGGLRGELERILTIEAQVEEPWEPVGWSKCSACGFFDHCWPRAEEAKSVGYVPDIDQGLTRRLRDEGIETYPEMAAQFDADALADLKSPSTIGNGSRDLAPARRILENVESLVAGKPLRRNSEYGRIAIDPKILADPHYVMFDLEGVPPELDDWEKIYLWGVQIFGVTKGEFRPAFAGFGPDGDEEGWIEFLRIARELLDQYEGIQFVHWASFETAKIKMYMERYPQTDLETAGEVLERLVDLLPIAKAAVALPLPSYSLKVVEKLSQLTELTGFSRSTEDVNKGDDSIAAYMEAVEAKNEARRDELMTQLAAYNQEDLEATWAVQSWLRHLARTN